MFAAIAPGSRRNSFRQKRVMLLNELIADVLTRQETCRVLDLGGTDVFWSTWHDMIDWERVTIDCVNLDADGSAAGENMRIAFHKGDARDLSEFEDNAFDIVFSNSVIEHVGQWSDMQRMANEIRRLAPRYFVQTPNYWFPIEPHARTPFLHWLPEPWACRIVMTFKCGFWSKATTYSEAVSTVQSARLLNRPQMRELFPEATLLIETYFLFPKSLMSIRR